MPFVLSSTPHSGFAILIGSTLALSVDRVFDEIAFILIALAFAQLKPVSAERCIRAYDIMGRPGANSDSTQVAGSTQTKSNIFGSGCTVETKTNNAKDWNTLRVGERLRLKMV